MCVCSVSVCLFFFLLRGVWLGTVWCCWINLSVPFPSLSPMLSLRTCHTVTDHTVKHHTVFGKRLACLGMPYKIRQDVASCREHVMCARLASCACLSRGRECTSEEHSCSQLLSTPLCCSRENGASHYPWLLLKLSFPPMLIPRFPDGRSLCMVKGGGAV